MFKRKPNKGPSVRIETLIGARTRIHGNVEFAGGLHVDGLIHGDVRGATDPESVLSVSEGGCIEGSVVAASVVLNGTVKGHIDASGRVELGERAIVLGDVSYRVIETAVGAQIKGKLTHRSESLPAAAEPPAEGASEMPGEAAVPGVRSGERPATKP